MLETTTSSKLSSSKKDLLISWNFDAALSPKKTHRSSCAPGRKVSKWLRFSLKQLSEWEATMRNQKILVGVFSGGMECSDLRVTADHIDWYWLYILWYDANFMSENLHFHIFGTCSPPLDNSRFLGFTHPLDSMDHCSMPNTCSSLSRSSKSSPVTSHWYSISFETWTSIFNLCVVSDALMWIPMKLVSRTTSKWI